MKLYEAFGRAGPYLLLGAGLYPPLNPYLLGFLPQSLSPIVPVPALA